MHFKLRLLAEDVGWKERTTIPHADALFRASIHTLLPLGHNHSAKFVRRHAASQKTTQVDSIDGVEAQVPRAISRKATAIAVATERSRRGCNDAEDRAV
ncbi:MAG TPA: hypothetical protein VLV86_00720, partial [Vicinamibacterales bacterium]|nr:hypothetical protein [Vicinamibacterales bacterium]